MGEGNTRHRQPSGSRERVQALLAVAAQIWLEEVEPPPGPGIPYSAVGSAFLHEAEGAWFDAAGQPA